MGFVMINFPTFLTLIRLVLSPLMLPILFVYLLPYNIAWINYSLAMLFVFFSLTDFFDGYLARRLQQETSLGKILDPIADKFLIYSTLVSLLAIGKIYFYWVILLVGREFFMMGLRHIALEHNFTVPVSWLGKIKTVVQMVFLTVVIVNPYNQLHLWDAPCWNGLELILLILSLYLSLASAQRYYVAFMKEFRRVTERVQEVGDGQ
jgi:CDP-diacylglycerol--glycerol-3-phosphate 3-phosphatidyltransferase